MLGAVSPLRVNDLPKKLNLKNVAKIEVNTIFERLSMIILVLNAVQSCRLIAPTIYLCIICIMVIEFDALLF